MSAKKAEKICPGTTPGAKRDLKKKIRRARRRSVKRLGEEAPTKLRHFIRGWDD